tara:strand:- start:2199 stop:2999 length:801 start_codon:yes stop_codon:yes gene_type:complete
MAKDVAVKKETTVVAFDADILLADSGAGMEGMTQDDLMIPRLSMLQKVSDQVNKRHGAYVEGAEPGHIFDNVMGSITDGEKGVVVVPISYRRLHIEWKPDRQGLVADHGSDPSCLANCERGGKGEYVTDEGNEIVPTGEYFVYVINEDDGSFSPAMLSMSKSQLKKARRWNSMINRLQIPHPNYEDKKLTPAMFWNAYRLTTVPEENDLGDWFGWDIEMLFDAASGGIIQQWPTGQNIYMSARNFKKQLASGEVKVSPEATEDDLM